MLSLVTGGARSGKSVFAENLAGGYGDVSYIATAIPFDDEMKDRIKKHRLQRPQSWQTLEAFCDFDSCSIDEINEIEEKIKCEFEKLVCVIKERNVNAVLVTNEVGMGIVPENRLSRIFRDIAGRINQYLAKQADEVYLVTCGIEMKIKG